MLQILNRKDPLFKLLKGNQETVITFSHLADMCQYDETFTEPYFHFNFLPQHAAFISIITISLRGDRLLIKLYWVIIQCFHFCLIG